MKVLDESNKGAGVRVYNLLYQISCQRTYIIDHPRIHSEDVPVQATLYLILRLSVGRYAF